MVKYKIRNEECYMSNDLKRYNIMISINNNDKEIEKSNTRRTPMKKEQ